MKAHAVRGRGRLVTLLSVAVMMRLWDFGYNVKNGDTGVKLLYGDVVGGKYSIKSGNKIVAD